MESVNALLAIAITNHFSIEQMNMEKTYLNGILRETMYASAQKLHRRQQTGVRTDKDPNGLKCHELLPVRLY